MELGAFSVSLAVKDLDASRSFYEKLGFSVFAGDAAQNWLILKNGATVVGLFQGMFEKNILTFNPGWDSSARPLAQFTDVRDLQRQLKAQGVEPQQEADESTTGPASFVVVDPGRKPDPHRSTCVNGCAPLPHTLFDISALVLDNTALNPRRCGFLFVL